VRTGKCQGTPNPWTTVDAQQAFHPIPGASAIGYFSGTPMKRHPTSAARHVAAVAASSGIPAYGKIDGFTKTM
jgi:hypothetical protein